MSADKKTMYEVLGVRPQASLAEIKAAHRRLSMNVMTGQPETSREDIEVQLKLLDMALDTLSDPGSRGAYDAKLSLAAVPAVASVPRTALVGASISNDQASELAAAVVNDYKLALASEREGQISIQAISSSVGATASALRKILRLVAGLIVLGIVLRTGQFVLGARRPVLPPSAIARAEEKLIIQQYFKKYGVRPASRAEAELLEREHRRTENERSAAEFAKQREEDEMRRFEEESREIGDRAHDELARAEAEERYQEMIRQQELRRQREAQGDPQMRQQQIVDQE